MTTNRVITITATSDLSYRVHFGNASETDCHFDTHTAALEFATRRATEDGLALQDEAGGYLRQLLKYAEQAMRGSLLPEYAFQNYGKRIQAQKHTPQVLRDEYTVKLHQLCEGFAKQRSAAV